MGCSLRAVARVDDVGVEHPGEKMRRAAGAVAHDDEIHVHRLKILAVS